MTQKNAQVAMLATSEHGQSLLDSVPNLESNFMGTAAATHYPNRAQMLTNLCDCPLRPHVIYLPLHAWKLQIVFFSYSLPCPVLHLACIDDHIV